eukprot:1149291-Pelagomonas_calceolata.AAC.4
MTVAELDARSAVTECCVLVLQLRLASVFPLSCPCRGEKRDTKPEVQSRASGTSEGKTHRLLDLELGVNLMKQAEKESSSRSGNRKRGLAMLASYGQLTQCFMRRYCLNA